ncbi:MAG: DUF3726 domain-containing protein [Rhodobacteraceae bacterium]|nr:DUF3726 domain-containing protein [Paracoccaceae bacterium]
MKYSLNEIDATCRKAARGAGFSWGLAEEAGKAARWLAAAGLPGPELLAGLLTQIDDKPRADFTPLNGRKNWTGSAGELCPIAAGAALNDFCGQLGEKEAITLENVLFPGLLLPFASAAAARRQMPVALQWKATGIVTDGSGTSATASSDGLRAERATVHCTLVPLAENLNPLGNSRAEPSVAVLETLGKLAHRIYAPATAESRLAGAGGGTTDGD